MPTLSPMGRVDVQDMMRARDARAQRQTEWLKTGGTLVCLTMNVPGATKVTPLIQIAFEEGAARVFQTLETLGSVERSQRIMEKTGLEAYFLTRADGAQVKRLLCQLEDEAPLGRLYDMDVLVSDGSKLSRQALGLPPRACLLCDQPAFVCARSRAHTVLELTAEINRRIRVFLCDQTAARLSALCVDSLLLEAETTPKPGLVDERNCGSHPDMTLPMFKNSARALSPYFSACARLGFETDDLRALFPLLQAEGVRAEKAMLEATGGANTHKGAIFSLGILCAAAAHGMARENYLDARSICSLGGSICKMSIHHYFEQLSEENAHTFGEKLYLQTGLRGIRGEAADGFQTLTRTALPALSSALSNGLTLKASGARVMLSLLATVSDTTLIKRGGLARQQIEAQAASAMLEHEITETMLCALDDRFIKENLTCGGCADLLACTYFLHLLTASNEQCPENLP